MHKSEYIKFADLVVDVVQKNSFGRWIYQQLRGDKDGCLKKMQDRAPKPIAPWKSPKEICGKFPCNHRGRIMLKNANGEERVDWRYAPHSGIYPGSLSEAAKAINQALQVYEYAFQWFEDDLDNEIIVPSKEPAKALEETKDILGFATRYDCFNYSHFWSDGLHKKNIYLKRSDAILFLDRGGFKHSDLEPVRFRGDESIEVEQATAALTKWAERQAWTPVQGALLVFGFIPPPQCLKLPPENTRLAGLNQPCPTSKYFHQHYHIQKLLDEWDGQLTPPEKITPAAWVRWCNTVKNKAYTSPWLQTIELELNKISFTQSKNSCQQDNEKQKPPVNNTENKGGRKPKAFRQALLLFCQSLVASGETDSLQRGRINDFMRRLQRSIRPGKHLLPDVEKLISKVNLDGGVWRVELFDYKGDTQSSKTGKDVSTFLTEWRKKNDIPA